MAERRSAAQLNTPITTAGYTPSLTSMNVQLTGALGNCTPSELMRPGISCSLVHISLNVVHGVQKWITVMHIAVDSRQ